MRELASERTNEIGLMDPGSEPIVFNEDMDCAKVDIVKILEQASMQIEVPYFDITVAGSKIKFFRERALLLRALSSN